MTSRHFWLYFGILKVRFSTMFFSQVSEAKEIKARDSYDEVVDQQAKIFPNGNRSAGGAVF